MKQIVIHEFYMIFIYRLNNIIFIILLLKILDHGTDE